MLPHSLILLINALLISGQQTEQLVLNTVFPVRGATGRFVFTIPRATGLTLTIALCSSSSPPQFTLSDADSELTFDKGLFTGANITGGSTLTITGLEVADAFEVAISNTGAIHERLDGVPLLGDSTSTQALLFSHSLASADTDPAPTFPNYTLPYANLSRPSAPVIASNTSTIVLRTADASNIPQTSCMISQESQGDVTNNGLWVRDSVWRNEFLVTGLEPATNYTTYFVQDSTKLTRPIYFATKSAEFPCQLVHALPYCPDVAYSIPLPPPPGDSVIYDLQTLPSNISDTFLSYMANFTTSLSTFACGRDWYSPLTQCSDCQREYRKWLCLMSFPRCGEPGPSSPDAFTSTAVAPEQTGRNAWGLFGSSSTSRDGPQHVFSALSPQPSSANPRNPAFPTLTAAYNLLLPCLEVCTTVDRACPNFIQFKCPRDTFNAGATYGVGYVDGVDGEEGRGAIGAPQDTWGNIWCNGG